MADALHWSDGLGDPLLSSARFRSIDRRFLLKACDDEVIRILHGIPDPDHFRNAADVALERAVKEKKEALELQVGDLKRRRL